MATGAASAAEEMDEDVPSPAEVPLAPPPAARKRRQQGPDGTKPSRAPKQPKPKAPQPSGVVFKDAMPARIRKALGLDAQAAAAAASACQHSGSCGKQEATGRCCWRRERSDASSCYCWR